MILPIIMAGATGSRLWQPLKPMAVFLLVSDVQANGQLLKELPTRDAVFTCVNVINGSWLRSYFSVNEYSSTTFYIQWLYSKFCC
jgi:hypothetical protein